MKSKPFLVALFGVIAAAAGIVGLAACGSSSSNTAHKHSAQSVAAVEATCTKAGNSAYYYCSGCGKYFSDSACTKEITKASTAVAAKGHTYVTTTVEATCTQDGYTESVCSACGDKKTTTMSAAGHYMTYSAAKEATCTEEGSTGYYYCSNCGKYFSDESGTNEIAQSDAVIETLSHTLTYTAAKAATCKEKGNIAYYSCSTCGKYFADEEGTTELSSTEIATEKTAHSLKKSEYKAATCTEEGSYEYYYCTVCNNHYSDEGQTPVSKSWGKIEKTAHNYVNGVCTVCGDKNSAYSGNSSTVTKTPSEGLEYTLSDDKTYYSVTGIGTCTDTDIVIPDTYENLPVKEIGTEAFCEIDTSTGKEKDHVLTCITVSDSVTTIGNYAFAYCTLLTDVTLSDGVTTIGTGAFGCCSALKEITIPDKVSSVGVNAFILCTSLTDVTIGNGVTEIGDCAFEMCSSLTNVTIGNSSSAVITLDDGAFDLCTSLTNITVNCGEIKFGYGIFDDSSLSTITLGKNVTAYTITMGMFNGCTSFTGWVVDENNAEWKSVDGNLYSKDGTWLISYAVGKTDTSFTIPDGVALVGDFAFYKNTSLTSITVADSVAYIGIDTFKGCSALTSVTFKNTSGWSLGDGTSISDFDLADASTAAKYLTDTYVGYYWSRS